MRKKIYVCDCCKREIENPYKAKMREFFMSYEYLNGVGAISNNHKGFKHRVHLCGECFKTIGKLGREVENE